jgi:hypothetical protein
MPIYIYPVENLSYECQDITTPTFSSASGWQYLTNLFGLWMDSQENYIFHLLTKQSDWQKCYNTWLTSQTVWHFLYKYLQLI